MRRLVTRIVVMVVMTLLPLVAVATPAHADATADQFLAKINDLRTSKGLRPLALDASISAFAQSWTNQMAESNHLSHNPNLASIPGNWTKAGENVGVGGDVDTLFQAFVNSPHHYANLVDPAYNLVGIGVAVASNGTLWTTHNFEARPATSAAPRTPRPAATTPTTARPRPPVTTATTAAPAAPPAPAPVAQPVALKVFDAPPPAPAPVAPARIRFSLEQVRGADPVL
jgi:hypothetical protein